MFCSNCGNQFEGKFCPACGQSTDDPVTISRVIEPSTLPYSNASSYTGQQGYLRGTSSTPMVLGIIGGVIEIPAAICSGACAASLTSLAEEGADISEAVGSVYWGLGLTIALIAIVFACLSKRMPTVSGVMLAIATLLSLVLVLSFNLLSLISCILLLLATIFCFTQKKERIQ